MTGERYARLRAACADGSPVDPDRQAAIVELDLATKARAIATLTRIPSPQPGGGNGGGESRAAEPPNSAGLAVVPPGSRGAT